MVIHDRQYAWILPVGKSELEEEYRRRKPSSQSEKDNQKTYFACSMNGCNSRANELAFKNFIVFKNH